MPYNATAPEVILSDIVGVALVPFSVFFLIPMFMHTYVPVGSVSVHVLGRCPVAYAGVCGCVVAKACSQCCYGEGESTT